MPIRLVACLLVLINVGACAPREREAVPPSGSDAPAVPTTSSVQERFWAQLQQLCGQAYAGALVSQDEADRELAGQVMTMHVRRCNEDRIEIPFHIGVNRSRTWVLTRTPDGLHLQHDHRHEDGTEDEVTLYGGIARDPGSEQKQLFPADAYSKDLFERNELHASTENVWSFELVPGERFSYILQRPQRHFRADFDLSKPVPTPPPAWGHASTDS